NWGTKPRAVAPSLAPLERLLAAGQPNEAPNYSMFDMSDGLGTSWRSVVVGQGDYASDQVTGTLVIGLPLATVNSTMAAFLAIFFGFGLTVVIFGAALTRLLVSATLQPLRSVESTAMSFAAGDYAQRLTESTPNTEVGRLSRSLNMMLGRIDEALDERQATIGRMRRFIGDASHELRTPLVTVRGYAELYRMGALDDPSKVGQAMDRIEKEALRMGGLVEDLLQLARLDETREFERAIVDLEPIAEDAAMDARAQSPNRPVSVAPTRVIPLGDASGGAEAGTTAVTGRTGGAGAGTGGAAGTGIATGTGANVGHGSNDDGEARAAIVAAGGTTYLGAPVPGQSGSPAAAPDARDPDARGAEASSADAVGSDAAGADADAGDPSGAAPTARPRRRWRPRTPTIPRVSRQQLG
ncbi:MAG: sensor histidine kinase, partial [Pseudoclavibacter sp.]